MSRYSYLGAVGIVVSGHFSRKTPPSLTHQPSMNSIGYPVATFVIEKPMGNNGGYNLGGANATGQVPLMNGNFGLIDRDTPQDAYTRKSWTDGHTDMQLIFSDEFNEDGRSFYPGDDPYWEAVDLHYWVRRLSSSDDLSFTRTRAIANEQPGMV